MIPAGTRSPTELAGREPALPGAAAASPPPRLVADGVRLRTGALAFLRSRGPGKPLPPQIQKCLLLCPVHALRWGKVVDVS